MSLLSIDDSTILGYKPVDEHHRQFIELVNRLDGADKTEFPILFQQLMEHTEEHFTYENRLMDQYAFPATTEHKGEHQRVMNEFKQFKKRVDKGLLSFGKAFVMERLPQWFELHIATMDSALIAHIKSKQ